jgi:hypothetical protein
MIPLFGLCHRASVVRKGEGYDCAGNITQTAESSVTGLLCVRFSTMPDVDQIQCFGNMSDERWRVVLPYTPGIRESDFLLVAPGKYPNNSAVSPAYYRVVHKIHRHDSTCCPHHTSVFAELDPVA